MNNEDSNTYSNIGFGVILHEEIVAIFTEFTLAAKFEEAYFPHLANIAQVLTVEAKVLGDEYAQNFLKKWDEINQKYGWHYDKMKKEEARLRFETIIEYMRVLGLIKPREEEAEWREAEIETLVKELK
jgi:predicted transcriptional regulator